MEKHLSFNDLPEAMAYLISKVERLEKLIENPSDTRREETEQWLSIKQLCDYHPDHPARATVYGWVQQSLIPHYKTGKKLSFKKSEIDDWLNKGRQLTDEELQEEAINHINKRRVGK